MNRGAPMKRTAFKSKLPTVLIASTPRRGDSFLATYKLTRPVNVARILDLVVAAPKENAIEHEGYRRLVAAFDCIHCGKANRSQHAHENEQKGKSLKLDDRRAMPLCCDEPGAEGCHTKFDQYRLLPGGREAHVAQGRIWARITRMAIEVSGHWPKNLPLWVDCRSSGDDGGSC